MTFDSLLPVFLATDAPDGNMETAFPFKFAGGFGLDVKNVGIVLSIQGAFQMFIYACVIPTILDRFGALRLFRFVAIAYFPLYLVTPYLVLLPTPYRMVGLAVALAWKSTFANIGYPSNAILITQSAPSPLLLGTINGVGASTASFFRSLAPTISGMLYAIGLKYGYSGLAWWFSALVSTVGAVIALRLQGKRPENKANVHDRDAERAEQPQSSANAQELPPSP